MLLSCVWAASSLGPWVCQLEFPSSCFPSPLTCPLCLPGDSTTVPVDPCSLSLCCLHSGSSGIPSPYSVRIFRWPQSSPQLLPSCSCLPCQTSEESCPHSISPPSTALTPSVPLGHCRPLAARPRDPPLISQPLLFWKRVPWHPQGSSSPRPLCRISPSPVPGRTLPQPSGQQLLGGSLDAFPVQPAIGLCLIWPRR